MVFIFPVAAFVSIFIHESFRGGIRNSYILITETIKYNWSRK